MFGTQAVNNFGAIPQGAERKKNRSDECSNKSEVGTNDGREQGLIPTTEDGINAMNISAGDHSDELLKDEDIINQISDKRSKYDEKRDDLVPLSNRHDTQCGSDDKSIGASSSCFANDSTINYYCQGQEVKKAYDMNQINTEASSRSEEPQWDDDSNPWLGCICGETHESPIPVFWVQCDSCDAWFNCAYDCVGFSRLDAGNKDHWNCPDCTPVELISEDSNISKSYNSRKNGDVPIATGTVVDVEDRTWAGSNKPGGVAKVIAYHVIDDDIFYDVKYILESRTESVESQYVSVNNIMANTFMSPAKSTRSS
eukprot:scaffold1199_cov253-Chaetoceros_neogracile.AAC.2